MIFAFFRNLKTYLDEKYSNAVGSMFSKVPCPFSYGIQTVAPTPGTRCFVAFRDVSEKQPYIINYFIDENNNYLGGAISPGIRLRYESLNNYTAKLPLLSLELFESQSEDSEPHRFIGNSTSNSIHSGVLNGVQNEINGFIAQYQEVYPKFIIILTGGDADFLAKRLKNTIFANSNFLLESLNQTFQYKIKND